MEYNYINTLVGGWPRVLNGAAISPELIKLKEDVKDPPEDVIHSVSYQLWCISAPSFRTAPIWKKNKSIHKFNLCHKLLMYSNIVLAYYIISMIKVCITSPLQILIQILIDGMVTKAWKNW